MLSLSSRAKLSGLGVPSSLLDRLSSTVPAVSASSGAPQPGAAPTPPVKPAGEPARNTHFESLAPAFSVRLFLALREANKRGVAISLFEGLRSAERQTWLYNQGRTRPGSIVTNAKTIYNSWHGYGVAADCVPVGSQGFYWPANENSIWLKWQNIASKHGLNTGLTWIFTDAPHTQPGYIPSYPKAHHQLALRSFGIIEFWKALDQFSLSESYIASL